MPRNKNKASKILLSLIVVAALATVLILYKRQTKNQILPPKENAYLPMAPDFIKKDHVLINVPFTSQAPMGHWEDPRQEDGCEEASILMAWLWVTNNTMTPAEAEKAITDMSDYELRVYGNYHDFNAEDSAMLMKDYFDYEKLQVVLNPTIDNIKDELAKDHIVLVPTNGQKLNNPHYKQPGPLTHMLVIKGFNDVKGIFITNDPGTRFGEGYEFSYERVYNAIVNYPSGNHGSQEGRPKAMIVVEK